MGYWKANSANGTGIFIHNNGTFFYGTVRSNFIKNGVTRFFNGAFFQGTYDILTGEFNEGSFYCRNGISIRLKYNNGKILKGVIEMPPRALNNIVSAHYPTLMEFDFETANKDYWWMKDKDTVLIEGPIGLIINADRGTITEGEVKEEKLCGDWFEYQKPHKYRFFKADGFRNTGKIKEHDFKKKRQVYVLQHKKNKENVEWFYYSGIHVKKTSKGVYKAEMKWLNSDVIQTDLKLDSSKLNKEDVKLPSGKYIYKDEHGIEHLVKFDELCHITTIKEIAEQRLKFDLVFKTILEKRPFIRRLIRELFEHVYSDYKCIIDSQLMNYMESNAEMCQEKKSYVKSEIPNEDSYFDQIIRIGQHNLLFNDSGIRIYSNMNIQDEDNRLPTTNQNGNTAMNDLKYKGIENGFHSASDMMLNDAHKQPDIIFLKTISPSLSGFIFTGTCTDQMFGASVSNPVTNSSDTLNTKIKYPANTKEAIDTSSPNSYIDKPHEYTHAVDYNQDANGNALKDKNIANFFNNNSIASQNVCTSRSNIKSFKGSIVEGCFEDYCEIEYYNGIVFKGSFRRGKRQGEGCIKYNEIEYHGKYDNDYPIGLFKQIAYGKELVGRFRGGQFVSKVIRVVNNLEVEVDNYEKDCLTGRYTIKLKDYDIECDFYNDQIVPKQKDCYLRKRDADEALKGKLVIEANNKKGIFITKDPFFYEINMQTASISKL